MHDNSRRVWVRRQTMTLVSAILSASLLASASGSPPEAQSKTVNANSQDPQRHSSRCLPTSQSARGWSARLARRLVLLSHPPAIDGSARRTAVTGRRR